MTAMWMPDLILLFCLFGAVQGVLLMLALLAVHGGDARSRRLLVAYVFGGAGSMATISLSHSGWVGARPTLLLVEYSTIGLLAPLLLGFARSALAPQQALGRSTWLHFLPGLLWTAYALFSLARGEEPWWPPFAPVILYQATYTALTAATFLRRRRASSDGRLTVENQFWLQSLLVFMALLHVAQIVRFATLDVVALRNVVPLTGSAGFCVITVLGLSRAFAELSRRRPPQPRRPLEGGRVARVADRLARLLETDKRYLDETLTLTAIADELSVSRSFLSRLVNERFGTGFLELVNRHRVGEARRLLSDPDAAHLTIEAVAARCGFRSRSTFYEAFRRETGQTPSAFRSAGDT